ncbi:MAG: hypothetical protein AABY65_06195 [Nitrospirota bacterium]
MANPARARFVEDLTKRFGVVRKLENSESLFAIGDDKARLYFRYSKKHPRNRTFFGLRKIDLQALEGHRGILCFFWEGQPEPLFIPFEEFEQVFAGLSPASDGQYKVQVYEQEGGTELYIANAGRFNVESYFSWGHLGSLLEISGSACPELSHVQVQTLLGGVGAAKGFDIWIPPSDRAKLDWEVSPTFPVSKSLPPILMQIKMKLSHG